MYLNEDKKKGIIVQIIDSIVRTNKIPSYKDLNITTDMLKYYLGKLKRARVVEKKGYNEWLINKDELKKLKVKEVIKSSAVKKTATRLSKVPKGKLVRAHGFRFSLELPRSIKWKSRKKILTKNKIKFKKVFNSDFCEGINYRGYILFLTDNKIVITFPKGRSYYAKTSILGKNYAIYDAIELIKKLEKLFKLSFKIDNDYRLKLFRQHYAKVNDALALKYAKDEKKLKIRNEEGVWCITDYSFHKDELETVNSKTSDSDMDNVILPFMNDLKSHYDKTGEMLKFTQLMTLSNNNVVAINTLVQNQMEYAENIKSHINAIQELGAGVKKFTKAIEKFGNK